MASTKVDVPVIHRFGEPHKDIGGRRWYNGCGSESPDIVFVDSWPGDEIKRTNRPLSDRVGRCLQWLLKLADINPGRCYYTYAVKFPFPNGKKPSATDKHLCETMLREELETLNPKVVVAFGSDAWAAVADARKYPFACCRGEPLWFCDMPDDSGSTPKRAYWLFPTFNLPQVMMNGGEAYKDRMALEDIPQHILVHRAVHELKLVKRMADGEDLKATYAAHRPSYDVLTTPEQVAALRDALLESPDWDGLVCLDCEWDGKNWLDPGRYIRTVQLGVRKGYTAIVKLHEAGGLPVAPDLRPLWTELKGLLEHPRVGIVGHNVISDGEWLLQEGIDIRERVVYDTMLGEYLLCEDGPFGLEEAAMKYAPYGRYCSELECWVKTHGRECKLGFGNVPDDILMPYGAADVDCLRYIMEAQLPMIEKLGYMEPRGTEKQYPSMLQETLNTQKVLYEVEGTGMPVDRDQLNMLIDKFQSKKAELLSQVVLGAANVGMPEFNPGAPAQVKELLFKKLGLPPVKTTAGKDWAEAVGNVGLDEDIEEAPGTDKQTLEILGDRHPLCKSLLQYRRIETPCKTWLRHKDENNTDRGLEAQLWADGRLHSHMSQLSTTSRFKSSTPNCFPLEVEVLTSKGWMHWDEAYAQRDTDIQLAQWDPEAEDRAITFAAPTEWHTGRNRLLHVHNKEQLDIVCTPDHRFEVYTRRFAYGHKTLPAYRLSNCGELSIPGCGVIHASPGKIHLSDAQVTLLCAVQADGRLNDGSRGITLAFAKERKIERMRNALNALGFDYSEATGHYAYRKPMTRFYIKRKHIEEAFASQKVFNDLFQYDAETIRKIADEIVHWDGMVRTHGRSAGHKEYFSSIEQNIDWVQAVEVVSGYRARKLLRHADEMNTHHKPRWVVSIPAVVHDVSTRNTVTEPLPEADVYCATMPLDTLIVRYNGKVLFTRNSQNFPKKAEGFMTEIFGAGNEPPVVRTIVVPPPGMVMMEADFQQAELFTAASLSGDQHMLDVLKTPGRDMHTSIAAKSFGYHMYDDSGKEITEDDVVELVRTQYDGDAENKEFKAWQKHTYFVNGHGEKLTFSQFKSGPRISGKNVNFGIFYGRGGRDMAIQVKAETGAQESIDVLAAQFDQVIKTWKEVEYPVAWNFILQCMAKVNDPGYIRNPWGRIRRAPFLLRGQRDAGAERNFANFPIQSTVSDTVQIAMEMMQRWRVENNMHFEIQNQIHDAVMLHVPKDEIEETKYMFHQTMGNIHIPLKGTDFEHPGGPDFFTLGVDIDVYERWGKKI